MKKIVIYFTGLLFIIAASSGYTQKEGYIWYFGNKAGIDFNTTPPTALNDGDMVQDEGCASICDPSGNLLFYTDGISVWNALHDTMPNGKGMMGHSSGTQSGVIVPNPGNSDEYYLFSVPDNMDMVYYSMVDMTMEGGLGDIDPARKSIPLYPPGVMTTQKISAVRHANNNDIWVISHQKAADTFYVHLITNSGIALDHTEKIGSVHTKLKGYLKVSSDGTKLACAISENNRVELYDFNASTGEISNLTTFSNIYSGGNPTYGDPYGIEFSPDASKLYVSERFCNGRIYQYDLSSGPPYSSTLIATHGTGFGSGVGALQLAPDGKIYVSVPGDSLSVINEPDLAGAACDIQIRSFYLNGASAYEGLPTFIQTYFELPVDLVEFTGSMINNTV